MAEVKAKVKAPKKKASKREKKDWIAAYILIAPVTWVCWYFISGHLSRMSGSVLMM